MGVVHFAGLLDDREVDGDVLQGDKCVFQGFQEGGGQREDSVGQVYKACGQHEHQHG